MVIGRTGYVVLGLLLGYLVTTYARTWKSYAVAGVAAVALAAAAYSVSGNLQERTGEIVRDLQQWTPGAADKTSVGQRLEYSLTSLRIIAEHPLTGVGAGSFEQAYAKATTSELVTRNPHNDYMMIGAQTGVPGIVLLLALYVLLWRDAAHLGSRLNRDLVRGVVLTLAVGGLFNSLLLDHAEGLFFAWFVALAYARRPA
jgi:O-antigen ligase